MSNQPQTPESVHRFLEQNHPRYQLLEYNHNSKSKFYDSTRQIEFFCRFSYLKFHLKQDENFLFSPTKKEVDIKRQETTLKNTGFKSSLCDPDFNAEIAKKNTKYTIEKQWLYEKYWQENLSKAQIAKLVGCGTTTIDSFMKKYEIPFRTRKEATKISNNNEEKKEIFSKTHTGFKMTEEQKKNLSKKMKSLELVGPKNHNWKPPHERKTTLNFAIRSSLKNIEWKKAVIKKDNYSCVSCGKKGDGKLDIDHIIPLSFLIKENNIKTLEDAFACDKLWDISNGRTLCRDCHKKTETWAVNAGKYTTHKEENYI